MAKVDRSTREINQRVKRAVGNTSKRASNAGKMFLHVGGEFLKSNFPTPFAFVETNKDVLDSTAKFLRNPVDSVNRQINRALATDDFKALSKLAKNTLADLKSGNYYDPDRHRDAASEQLDAAMAELDNFDFDFGGFDLSDFDENGDWVDSSDDAAKADVNTQLKVAYLQNAKDDARTTATVNAIVGGTQAQIQNDNANAQVNIRMMLKQHSEMMQTQESLIQGQQATFELISKSSEAHANLFREAHNQVMSKFDTTIDLLKKIEANTQKPVKTERKRKEENDIFGLNGELNMKAYVKAVKKNINDKMFSLPIGIGGVMGMSFKDIIEQSFGDNPVDSLVQLALNLATPKGTKKQMERTSKNMQGFLPALMQKMTERGRLYETGKSNKAFDMLMGILAPGQESKTGISTRNSDYLKAAQITNKTVRAIEEVIPMWLSRIDSHLTGGPMMVYDYEYGRLRNAGKVVAETERSTRNLAKNIEGYYEVSSRAKNYKFKNEADQKAFLDFVFRFFQNAGEENKFINPWSDMSTLMRGMDVPEGSNYDNMLMAILRNMNPDQSKIKGFNKAAAVQMAGSIAGARRRRNDANFRANRDLAESGLIGAWSFMDEDTKNAFINSGLSHYNELSDEDIEKISEQRRKALLKNGGVNASNVLLTDILKTLRSGIITYNVGLKGSPESLPDYVKERIKVKRSRTITPGTVGGRATSINDPATQAVDELYANTMSLDELMAQQGNLSYNKEEDERQREIERLRKEGKDPTNRYNDTLRDKTKYYKKAFEESNFGKLVATTREIANNPFKLFNSALQMVDDMMYKTLFGTDALKDGEEDGPIDRRDSPSILKTTMNIIAKQFNQLSGFVSSTFRRIDDYLFAPEHGLFAKAMKSLGEMLGFGELKDKAMGKAKNIRDKIKSKVVGTKGEDGKYSGGWASNLVNNYKEGKGDLEGTIKGAINKLLYGDYAASKGKFEGFVVDEQGNATQKKDYGGVIGKIRKSFDGLNDFLFGEGAADDKDRSKAKWKKVKGAFKEAAPKMTAGAGIGAITGLFLPGGPVLGAILGSVTGLVSGSSDLKKYLFGEFSDEDEDIIDPETGKVATDWKGNKKTRKKQIKTGIISQDTQDALKKVLPGAGKGAIAGILASGLGILPGFMSAGLTGVIGAFGGMVASSDNFKKMIFGDSEDPKSGLISKEFREKAMKSIKKVAPSALGGAAIGGGMAAIMGNLGIFPGLMLGPGGPIMATLGAITMGSQADKINKFLFGEETESEVDEKDKDGNVIGKKKVKKREGGIFGKAYDYMKDKVMEPIAKGMNNVVKSIGNWFKEDVLGPLGRSIEPLKDKLKEAGASIKESLSNIGNSIATGITRALGIVPEDQDMKTFWEKNVKGKLKQTFNNLFSGLGKLIGKILSAPFKALESIVRGTTQPGEEDDGLGDGTGAPKKRGLFARFNDNINKWRDKRKNRRFQRAGENLGNAFKESGSHLGNIGYQFADFADTAATGAAKGVNKVGGVLSRIFGGKSTVAAATTSSAAATGFTMAQLQAMPVADAIQNIQKKQSQGIPLTPAEQSFIAANWRRVKNTAGNVTQNRSINQSVKGAVETREPETETDEDTKMSRADRRAAKAEAKEERKAKKKSASWAKDNHDNIKKMSKNTAKIYDEIRGQLGGLGWNVAYIKTLLENQYGPLSNDQLPEEMEGSTKSVHKKRGFFGKMRDKASDIFHGIGNKLGDLKDAIFGDRDKSGGKGKGGGGGIKAILRLVFTPFRILGKAAGFITDRISDLFDVIGVAIKSGVQLLGDALHTGAQLIVGAAKGIGSAIGDAATLFIGTLKDLGLSVTAMIRGTLQFLSDTIPSLAADVIHAGVGLAKGIGKGVIKGVKWIGSGIKGIGTKIKAHHDKKKGITTKTKIERIGTFQIAGGYIDDAGTTFPMIGDKLAPQPVPLVSMFKGKPHGTIPYAIPVYVANDSVPTVIKNMMKGDKDDNLDRDYTNTYKSIDRQAESNANPAEVYDKAIANAKTKEERDAILHAAQLNVAKQQLALPAHEGSGEEEKSGGLLSTIINTLTGGGGGAGGLLKAAGGLFAGSKLGKLAAKIIPAIAPIATLGLTTVLPGMIGTFKQVEEGDLGNATIRGARTFTQTGVNAFKLGGRYLEKAGKTMPLSAEETKLMKKFKVAKGIGNTIADTTKNAVTKLTTWIKNAFTKLFSEKTIKNAIANVGEGKGNLKEKLLAAVSKNLDKWVEKAGKISAAQLLKKANIYLMIAGAVVDFTKGYRRADRYFDVDHSDLTLGMKLTAGLCNALSGLAFGLIPEEWLTQTLYSIFANAEDKQNLADNQNKLKNKVATYNSENNTNYTVEEFQDKFKEDGSRRSPGLFKGIWNWASTGNWYGDVNKNTDDPNYGKYAPKDGIRGINGTGRWGHGPAHYSQRDSRWNHGTNMADVGCGPTAAAIVGSAYGDKRNPLVANAMSYGLGMRSADGGTDPRFFSQYAVSSNYGMAQGPNSSTMVASNLAKGQPVVMMGKGGAFGSGMHYMVADKMMGRNRISMIDPYTGGTKSGNLGSIMKNTSSTIYSYGKGPGSGGRGNGFGGNVRGAQQALCNKMAGVAGKIRYTTSGAQDPDQGTASCASMCGWAYKKVFPDVFTNAPMSSNAYYSSVDSRFETIYVNDGTQSFNMNMLQPGDLLYFDWRTTRIMNGKMSHVDMYAGNNMVWYHGGEPIMGPTKKAMTDYRIQHLMKVRRYKPFIDGSVKTYDDSEVNYTGSATNGSDTDITSDGTFFGQISNLFQSAGEKFDNFFGGLFGAKTSSDDTSSGSTVSGSASGVITSTSNIGLSTNTRENGRKIWKFFKDKGLSNNQIAGIVGNLYQESLLRPENVSDYFNKKTGITDDGYTNMVNNGTYKTFATDGEGYGLPMWTVSDNKGPLLESAKKSGKSVGDLGLQLDFLWNDLNTKYKDALMDPIRQSDSLEDIAVRFMQTYEKPAGYKTEAKKQERINAAKTVLSQFGTGRGDLTNLTSMNNRIRGMNSTITKLNEFGKGESTAVMATKQITDAIKSNEFGKGPSDATTQQMLQLMTKAFGQMISLLSDIKDNTNHSSDTSSSTRGKSMKTVRGDNYSANMDTESNSTDYGRIIVDNLTRR